jgi:hypothetical protein
MHEVDHFEGGALPMLTRGSHKVIQDLLEVYQRLLVSGGWKCTLSQLGELQIAASCRWAISFYFIYLFKSALITRCMYVCTKCRRAIGLTTCSCYTPGPTLNASGVLASRLLDFLSNKRPSAQEKIGDKRLDRAQDLAQKNGDRISDSDLKIARDEVLQCVPSCTWFKCILE